MEEATESYRGELDPQGLCVRHTPPAIKTSLTSHLLLHHPPLNSLIDHRWKSASVYLTVRRHVLITDPTQNAAIISQPQSDFIDRWLASYETFDESQWNHHSVVKPWQIARRFPNLVQVLNIKAMFWPMWYGNEIEKVHERDEWDFYASGQYA